MEHNCLITHKCEYDLGMNSGEHSILCSVWIASLAMNFWGLRINVLYKCWWRTIEISVEHFGRFWSLFYSFLIKIIDVTQKIKLLRCWCRRCLLSCFVSSPCLVIGVDFFDKTHVSRPPAQLIHSFSWIDNSNLKKANVRFLTTSITYESVSHLDGTLLSASLYWIFSLRPWALAIAALSSSYVGLSFGAAML